MSTCECKVCISWAAKTPRGRSRDRQNFFGGFSFVLKLGNSQRADPAAGNSSTDTDVQHCSKTNISESHTSSICFAFQGVSVPHTSVLRDQESKLDQQRLIKEGEKKKEKKKKKEEGRTERKLFSKYCIQNHWVGLAWSCKGQWETKGSPHLKLFWNIKRSIPVQNNTEILSRSTLTSGDSASQICPWCKIRHGSTRTRNEAGGRVLSLGLTSDTFEVIKDTWCWLIKIKRKARVISVVP